MKTYYCVVSSFDNHGRVTAAIVDAKEAEQCPESTTHSDSRKDVYIDWYDSHEEAAKAVENTRLA